MLGMLGARFLLPILVVVSSLLGLVQATPAHAMGMTGTPVETCVAPVRPGQTIQDLLGGRIKLDCTTRQNALGPGDFWALSGRIDRSGELALRTGSVWQQARTVYIEYADGKIVRKFSDSRTASTNLQLGAIFFDRVPARPVPVSRIAWKVTGSANVRGIVIGARLATIRENGWSNLQLAALYACFGGIGLALIIHHLALWTAMRHRFQLAYCLMVLMLLVYGFSSSGVLAWMFPWIDNNDRLRINYIALGLTAASALMFARAFFEERVFAGWLNHVGTGIAITVVAASTAYGLLAPWHMALLDRVFALSYLLLVGFVPVFLTRAWMQRSNYLWLFALAWAMPVVFACVRVAHNLNLIPWSFWVDNSTLISMASEALLSSVGIAYRIRLLSRERDEARVQELAARALADIDPLTGLLNRRAFLSQVIGRPGDQRLLILDIDHFKAVNETIGHDGGDEVLRIVARALRASVPPGALVARLGGEEFAILTAETSPVAADDVLARLRAERMPFDLCVTASIGLCTGPLATEADWKHLYRAADRALYDAKADGRDRARVRPSRAVA